MCVFLMAALISLIISMVGLQVYGQPTDRKLDDPNALPGQIIIAGSNPGFLKYNGGGPVFLAGPDNPEDFLFQGTLNEDGTRSGRGQEGLIERMAAAGVNAFHCQMFRMRRCNIKDEGAAARRYFWSCAMEGIHTLEAYIHANDGNESTLKEMGFLNKFMEQTPFHRMIPRDDLASRSTKWVLARPGESYVAYSYEYLDKIGLKGLVAGTYDLFWMDTVTGETSKQDGITVDWGNVAFAKPESFGSEVVGYIQLHN